MGLFRSKVVRPIALLSEIGDLDKWFIGVLDIYCLLLRFLTFCLLDCILCDYPWLLLPLLSVFDDAIFMAFCATLLLSS